MKSGLAILLILSFLILVGTINALQMHEERHLKNIRQLTFEGDNAEAYFSFDGKKLIYQSNSPSGGHKKEDNKFFFECDKIWTMNIDGTEKTMVSSKRGAHTCSFFFPDGKRIVYASTIHLEGDCPPKKVVEGQRYVWSLFPYDIYVANIDGTNPKKLTDNPDYDAEAIVSPDGKKIVFTSKRNGDLDIYIMDSDGFNVKRLTDRYGYDGGPWFSPDGKKIVWRAWYPETEEERLLWKRCMEGDYVIPVPLDLWIMDVDGSNKRRILHNNASNFAPSWHPDGKRIIFSSNMDDWREDLKAYGHNFELYIINDDGSGLKRLTYNKVFDGFPMFSPDGKKLVFASNRDPSRPRDTDIFIADWSE
jgi:Tol biopolymer transport system component